MKKIAVLGSTGSVGRNALRVLSQLKGCEVIALSAGSNIDLLEKQIALFSSKEVAVFDETAALLLAKRCPQVKVLAGREGVSQLAASKEVDFVLMAIAGTAALLPTIAAIEAKKEIGLASKEVLVSAGDLIMRMAAENGVRLLPVDSEHSAIFQCLQGENTGEVRRLILTASGGPFRRYSYRRLKTVTAKEALRHPTYSMGSKISIDSATLMNKGLEVIEAHYLFNMPGGKIEVAVHPQSIVHSMVEFIDGAIMAQLSPPDMALPIQYALTYPQRAPSVGAVWDVKGRLDFFAPDLKKFPCLALAYEALSIGKSAPCYLNGANEVLVARFLQGKIAYLDIANKLEKLLALHRSYDMLSLQSVLEVDKQAREAAQHV